MISGKTWDVQSGCNIGFENREIKTDRNDILYYKMPPPDATAAPGGNLILKIIVNYILL
jgi:hypothetical protein